MNITDRHHGSRSYNVVISFHLHLQLHRQRLHCSELAFPLHQHLSHRQCQQLLSLAHHLPPILILALQCPVVLYHNPFSAFDGPAFACGRGYTAPEQKASLKDWLHH